MGLVVILRAFNRKDMIDTAAASFTLRHVLDKFHVLVVSSSLFKTGMQLPILNQKLSYVPLHKESTSTIHSEPVFNFRCITVKGSYDRKLKSMMPLSRTAMCHEDLQSFVIRLHPSFLYWSRHVRKESI